MIFNQLAIHKRKSIHRIPNLQIQTQIIRLGRGHFMSVETTQKQHVGSRV